MRVIRFGIKSQNAAQESSSNSAVRNLDNQLRTRRKVAKMLIAVVIMFFINYFPVYFFPVLQVSLEMMIAPIQALIVVLRKLELHVL